MMGRAPRPVDMGIFSSLFRSPGSVIGFIGAVSTAVGACSDGFSHHPSGWQWGPMQEFGATVPGYAGLLSIFIGVLLLSVGWSLLFPSDSAVNQPPLMAVLVLWALPFLLVPPVMSADAFAYADLGWVQHVGGDPYQVHFGDLGGPYAASVDPMWAGNAFGYYPPLSLLANRFGAGIFGMHPYWGVIGQRLVALGGLALMVTLVPRLADIVGVHRTQAFWIGALNPVVLIHAVGGAHIDTLAVGLVMSALWLAWTLKPRELASLVVGPMLIGLAVAIKPYALVAVVAAAGWPVVGRLRALGRLRAALLLSWRSVLAGASAVLVFAAFSLASGFGFGWIAYLSAHYAASTPTMETLAPALLLGQLIELSSIAAGLTGEGAYTASLLLASFLLVAFSLTLLVLRSAEPVLLAAVGSIVAVSWGQALHPWYLILGLALLGLVPLSGAVVRRLTWVVGGFAFATTFVFSTPWVRVGLGASWAMILWLAHRTAFTDLGWNAQRARDGTGAEVNRAHPPGPRSGRPPA